MTAQTPATRGNGSAPAPARQTPERTILDLLTRSKDQIRAALPAHMKPDRMIRIALTSIRQNADLLKCTPISLVKCVIQASAIGLEPDPLLGQCYLVPYGKEATLIIGYKGIVTLARRPGEIASIQAHVVCEADDFDYEFGLNERLHHKPAFQKDRGKVKYAWALATFKDGGHQFEVMDWWELEAIRERSPAHKKGPWVTDTMEMYRKTPIRRLGKFLPLCPELQRHLAAEELAEAGLSTVGMFEDDGVPAIDTTAETIPSTTESDKVLARMGGTVAEDATVETTATTEPAKDLGWVHGETKPAREAGQD